MLPPLLISLPTGLTIGGVQVWAARLASELARRGHPTALLLHPEESTPLDIPLHPNVQVFRLPKPLPEGGVGVGSSSPSQREGAGGWVRATPDHKHHSSQTDPTHACAPKPLPEGGVGVGSSSPSQREGAGGWVRAAPDHNQHNSQTDPTHACAPKPLPEGGVGVGSSSPSQREGAGGWVRATPDHKHHSSQTDPTHACAPEPLPEGGVGVGSSDSRTTHTGRSHSNPHHAHSPHPKSEIANPKFPPLRQARGDLSPFLPTYRHAITALHAQTQKPVICIPQHLGDSAGLFAALTREIPDLFRIAGWCQLDSPYDLRVLDFYAPVMRHVAAVSDHLEHALRARLPDAQVWNIPNATPITPGARPRLNTARPRLLYLGRLDRDIKRVLALPALSRELTQLGLRHELTIIGDGPAREDLARACASLDTITLRDAASPGEVPAILDDHDIFILPSRTEGLSLALLEALSRGCVPFITHTDSGAAQVVNNSNGVLVPTPTTADEHTAGRELARAIAANLHRLPHLSRAAIASITTSRYTLEAQADATEHFLRAAAAEPPLIWPNDRNPSFTAPSPHGSGATPPNAELHLRALLDSLEGRTLLIHGVGNHTTELLHVFADHAHHIAAFTDDNPATHNTTLLDRPVLPPTHAHTTSATNVIISSWLHQTAIHARKATYEAQGLTVHRIYVNVPCPAT